MFAMRLDSHNKLKRNLHAIFQVCGIARVQNDKTGRVLFQECEIGQDLFQKSDK